MSPPTRGPEEPPAPRLLTPGPLSTAPATRQAMLRDWGSRDPDFVAQVTEVRERLVRMAGGTPESHAAVLLQGSGTFSVEAMIGTFVPRDGRLLVLVNGAYGRRMCRIAEVMGRRVVSVCVPDTEPVNAAAVDLALATDREITHVAIVHCETTTGLLNPVEEIARVVAFHERRLLVDAMSAFGSIPLDVPAVGADAVAASSNKCLEGPPGMGFVIARRAALAECSGNSHSLSLDLHDQQARFERDGQWRFTPPTHVLAALHTALRLHDAEGGVAGRGARYRESCRLLVDGMRKLGFETLLPDGLQAPIIVTFHLPPTLDFEGFYAALAERGFLIYPGKLTEVPTFRVGCIGDLQPDELRAFVRTVAEVVRL